MSSTSSTYKTAASEILFHGSNKITAVIKQKKEGGMYGVCMRR